MTKLSFDIDIDFQPSFKPLTVFPQAVPASMVQDKRLVKHPCGIYLQNIPIDTVTKFSAIPYKEAEELSFFKIDCLHLTLLDSFYSKDAIRQLLKEDPDWTLLHKEENVKKLLHIHNHFYLIDKIKPNTIQELADCLALMRPAKKHLIEQYVRDKESIRKILYLKTGDEYYFKKSHAISYALTISLQLHLIELGKL